jgi:hypothetical protein
MKQMYLFLVTLRSVCHFYIQKYQYIYARTSVKNEKEIVLTTNDSIFSPHVIHFSFLFSNDDASFSNTIFICS